jgi:hypothetical protein
MKVSCQAHTLTSFLLGKGSLVIFYERMGEPRAGLDAVKKRKISFIYRETNLCTAAGRSTY